MAQPILVTQSTSVVQVDTSQVTFGSPAVVLLSTLNAPGVFVTIRDIAGLASTNRGIILSTTKDVHFLDGPTCNIYTINQPYGFLTVTPKTSTIWAVTNTFAFPEGSTAANVNQFTANFATISSVFANQAQFSTVGISSLSTDTTQVRYTLSVGQSTVTDSAYVKGSLTALSSISTAGSVFAASSITTSAGFFTSTLQVPRLDVQLSTGVALNVAGILQVASTVSTAGSLFVGGNISTQGNLVVGGNFAINGGLQLTGLAITGGVSTSGTLGVAQDVQTLSSLLVKDNATFFRHASIASNLTVGSALSVMSNTFIAGSLQVNSNFLALANASVMSNMYVASSMSIGGNLAVDGNLVFNDVILDLNNLSVFSTLTVGTLISTTGNAAIGQGLRVQGSTLLLGLLSTASSINVGGSISTTGNLAVGGAVDFCSTLSVRGAVTKLSDVNIGGLLSTQSTMIVGDTLRVNSNMFVGGVISSVSTINAAGNLLIGGQTNLSSGLSTIGTAAFFSSVQIQGSVSVMSSLVVRQDVTVQGTLNASGFSLPGAAAVASLGVQTSTGISAVFAGSTVQTGLLSTLGGINMGGQFSTTNVIVTGSTLFARNVVATASLSSLSTLGVAGDVNVLGSTLMNNLTVNSNTTLNCNVTFNGLTGPPYSVVFNAQPNFTQGMNVSQTLQAANVTAFGSLNVGVNATFSNLATTSSLTVTGNTLMSNFTSTLGQAAFFSSVAIQGNVSVFSSMNVSCNLTVGGVLTAQNVQLPGGAILQTLAVTSNAGFSVNVSSSTLHAGLFSTSGAIFTGREISTMSSLAVGGAATILQGLIVGGGAVLNSSLSTFGQAAFFSSVQIQGSVSIMSSIVIRGNTRLEGGITLAGVTTWAIPILSANKLQASSFGLNVANSLNAFDMAGTAAIQGTGASNTLVLSSSNNNPGILLSNPVNRFTLFNSSNNSPVGDGSLAIYNNSLADYHMVLLSSGNTAIRKTTAAAPLDVNGLALASNMGAPQAQFSTLGAEFLVASTFGVRVLGASSFTTSTATLAASATIPQLFVSSISSATLTASNVSTLTLQANLATVSTLSTIGNVNVGSNLTVGSSTLVANVASNTVQMNAPLTQGRRLRLNLISGTGTFSLGYATDLNTNFTYVSGLITGGARGFATNGDIIVAFGNGGSTTPFATSYDGVNWTGGSSNLFTSVARVIWDGRRFVAVGTGSSTYAAITSPDGFNWSEVTTAPVVTGNTFALGFNGSLYVVGFSQGAVYTTPDLVTWTQRTSQFSSNVRAILWTRFNWIMGGNGTNRFASSPDGITWTPITALNTLITANTARTFAVNGSTVVVGGWTTGSPGTGIIAYSLNSGTTWTQADLTTNSVNFTTIEAIWWTGAYYVASGTSSTGGLAATSVDGLVWSPLSVSFTSGAHGGLAINYTTTLRQTTFGLLAADSISTAGTLTVSDVFRVGDSTIVSDPLRKNTGINCNAPRYSLDVNGNINAAGFLLNGEAFTGGGGVSSNVSTSRFLTSSIVTSSLNTSVTAILSNSQRSNYFVGSIQRANNSGVLLRSLDGITWATVTNPNANFAAFTYLYNGSQWIMGGTVSGGISSALYTSPDGSNWTSVVQTGYANQYVFTIGWNGSYYLIGGLDGTAGPANSNTRCLTRTTDFTTFTPATNQVFTGGACRAVAWNGTLWVAVGTDSFVANVTQAIKYSFDGVTWTNIPSGGFTSTSSAQGLCVLWNGRMFVAGGQESAAAAGAVMKYSYDGIAWFDCVGPVGRAAAARSVNGIGWNGRRFVAVGEGAGFTSSILYSDDGISWQYANGTFSGGGSRVAWNGSRWVASGSDSTAAKVFQYSSDGITWTNGSGLTETSPFTVAVAATSNVFPDAQIGNTYFYNGQQPNFITNLSTTNTVQQFSNALLINELYTENNGFTGINCNAPQTALAVNGFATFNKTQDPLTIVFAVNRNTSTVTTSINNGSNWFYPPGTSPLQYGTTACWDGRRFLLAASSAASSTDLYTSSNGINWSPVTISGTFQNSLVNAMIWTGVNYIAVGRSTANSNAMICRSVDGSNWTAATSGGFSPVATQAQGFDVAYDGRTLVAVGIDDTGASIKRSTDNGATWTNATAGAFSAYIQNVNVFGGRGVATNGRVWVAVGADASASSTIKYSTNSGSNWNSVPSGGFSGGGGAVAWNGRYFLATGNDTANGVQYSLDGINWMGVSWPSATYSGIGNIIWTGTEWRMSGNLVSGGLAYTVTATGDLPPVMGTPTTFAGTSTANDLACSSNVYPDFQVENLAIYGRNQYPMNLSTNFIYLNSNGMNLNNLLLLSNNADALTAQNGTLRVAAAQTVFNVLNYASNGVSSTRALLRLTQSGGTFLFQSGSNETGNSRANMAFVPMYTGAAGANLFLDMVNSRVGVGTSAPSATLHISNTATIASNVLQVSASTTQLYFGKGSSEDKTFVQLSDDGAVDAFKYGTLQITRPGNPVDGKFHISMIRQGNMVAGLGYLSNTNTFLISTNGAALYLASDAGKVGLNQSNPTYPLTVSYNNSAGGYLESGILISNASATNSAQLALQTGTTMWNLTANGTLGTPAGGFNILNCNTSRMTITTSGNVGIGTTNPQRFLHLSNTDNTYFRINSPSTNQAVMEFNYNEQNVLCWQIGRQAGAPAGTTGPLFIYSQVKPGTLVEFYHTGDVNFAYNVGIGTSNPQAQLHLSNGGANTAIRLDSPSTNQCAINFVENNAGRTWQIGKQVGIPSGYTGEFYIYSQVLNAAPFSAYHNGNVKFYSSMVIGGVAAPSTATLQVINPNSGENNHFFVDGVTGQLRMFAGTAFAGMKYVRTANTTVGQPLYFNTNGIGIGTSNPQAPLTILGGISNCLNLEFGGNNLGIGPQIGFTANAGSAPMCAIRGALMITGGSGDAGNMIFSTRLNGTSALSDRMIILSNGLVGVNCNSPTATLTVNGSVSKTSGSFDIPHPIKKGYRLVHSFIEGPRVDLIYRGKKQLSNGTIMVDLEKEATANGSVMSPGTFDALCTNAEVFLQNNDTFDRVKGHVSSHILTIESENPVSAATINWMVIAERKDPSIKEWNMTDSNGFLVLEYASPSP